MDRKPESCLLCKNEPSTAFLETSVVLADDWPAHLRGTEYFQYPVCTKCWQWYWSQSKRLQYAIRALCHLLVQRHLETTRPALPKEPIDTYAAFGRILYRLEDTDQKRLMEMLRKE